MASWRTNRDNGRRVKAGEVIAPSYRADFFQCNTCAVYDRHIWEQLQEKSESTDGLLTSADIWKETCINCEAETFWKQIWQSSGPPTGRQVYPVSTEGVSPHHADMPPDVAEDYDEAAAIAARSPRGAGAMLRLALQKLMPHLGETSGNLNTDIASLVRKGLDVRIQRALDGMRVIGNNAVHPLEINVQEDPSTVMTLFGLLNFIVEQMITQPRQLEAFYSQLPEGALNAIEERDGPRELAAAPDSENADA